MQPIAIGFDDPSLASRANELVLEFNLTVDQQAVPRLHLTAERLELRTPEFSPLFVDFNASIVVDRDFSGRKHDLVRACKPAPGVLIIDLTAGWGRDAAILAHFGADVLMIERNPMMAALLFDGLRRMHPRVTGTLRLIHMQSMDYLETLLPITNTSIVIYMDPMHPARKKSALVKKDMRAMQLLLGPDQDVLEVLNYARTRSCRRVVVKWPQKLPALVPADLSFPGKTVRFDIYFCKK